MNREEIENREKLNTRIGSPQGPKPRDSGWEQFIEKQRREIEARRNGQLARLLIVVLPEESGEELGRMVEEEQRRAQEGLVELGQGEEARYKHVDELTAGDVPARLEAESDRAAWLAARMDRVREEVYQSHPRRIRAGASG
ncbi:hypothetical protein [Rubrobacter aplysinae]|uniref:hypothetical protein n=1 Tax=Rubrobacter aplysinae TaxID=909625 RepID=UPI00064BB089|nr:hypothetical protein [Rubrobacter aplysinae]